MAKRKNVSRKVVLSATADTVIIGGKNPHEKITDNGDGTYTWGKYKGQLMAITNRSFFQKEYTTITTPDNVIAVIGDGDRYQISDLRTISFED